MANIYLIGPMGAGKSTVARFLAERLQRSWTDTDLEVEEATGLTIPAIFAAEGEDGFRRHEEEALARVAHRGNLVVATGGGIVVRPVNRMRMRNSGRVIYLKAPPGVLYRRIATGRGLAHRPLLENQDPLRRLAALLAEREPLYAEAADCIVETAGREPEAIAEEIARCLEDL